MKKSRLIFVTGLLFSSCQINNGEQKVLEYRDSISPSGAKCHVPYWVIFRGNGRMVTRGVTSDEWKQLQEGGNTEKSTLFYEGENLNETPRSTVESESRSVSERGGFGESAGSHGAGG